MKSCASCRDSSSFYVAGIKTSMTTPAPYWMLWAKPSFSLERSAAEAFHHKQNNTETFSASPNELTKECLTLLHAYPYYAKLKNARQVEVQEHEKQSDTTWP